MIRRVLKSIKTLRKRANVTQKELAGIVGTRQATISEIENGTGNPSLETVRAIADALDAEIVIVPRRALKQVNLLIDEALAPSKSTNRPTSPGSALEDVFIPDDADPDEDDENRGQ